MIPLVTFLVIEPKIVKMGHICLNNKQFMFQIRNMNNNRDNEFIRKFGKNLRRIRQEDKISQETLADKAELPRSQIARIERGELNPTIKL